MRFLATAALFLTSSLTLTTAFHKGFNIGANRPDGSCKVQADWANNFAKMKALPGNFRDVRLYASSDCNTLQQAVPAAIAAGIQILVGVWTEDGNHYAAEKQALLDAVRQHGVGWISAISVGSEDLYRGNTDANTLAGQIYDIRGMMTTVGGRGIWVGHVDTWTAWVNGANAPVIKACDFIGMDGYPYFQGSSIASAKQVFYDSVTATQNTIKAVKPNTPLWITETGWPAAGPTLGGAVASPANAQRYWKDVVCTASPNFAFYAYTLRDYNAAPAGPAFGVLDINFQPLYSLTC